MPKDTKGLASPHESWDLEKLGKDESDNSSVSLASLCVLPANDNIIATMEEEEGDGIDSRFDAATEREQATKKCKRAGLSTAAQRYTPESEATVPKPQDATTTIEDDKKSGLAEFVRTPGAQRDNKDTGRPQLQHDDDLSQIQSDSGLSKLDNENDFSQTGIHNKAQTGTYNDPFRLSTDSVDPPELNHASPSPNNVNIAVSVWSYILMACIAIVAMIIAVLRLPIFGLWAALIAVSTGIYARYGDLDLASFWPLRQQANNEVDALDGNAEVQNGSGGLVTRHRMHRMLRARELMSLIPGLVLGVLISSLVFATVNNPWHNRSPILQPSTSHVEPLRNGITHTSLSASIILYDRMLSEAEVTGALDSTELHRLQHSRADIQTAFQRCELQEPCAVCPRLSKDVLYKLPDLFPRAAEDDPASQGGGWVPVWAWQIWERLHSFVWKSCPGGKRNVRLFAEQVVLAAEETVLAERLKTWGVQGAMVKNATDMAWAKASIGTPG